MVKLLEAARNVRLPVTYQVVELSLQVANISHAAAAAAAALQPEQQQQQWAGGPAAAWLWLCGRSLLALADVLLQNEGSGRVMRDDQAAEGLLQLSISLTPRGVLDSCAAVVQAVGALLHLQLGAATAAMPAAAAAAAHQGLASTLAAAAAECNSTLEQQLSLVAVDDPAEESEDEEERPQISSSSGPAPPSVLCMRELQRVSSKLSVGQQLKSFAAALCGLSPNQQCCNNPGCVSTSGLSEAALVGGKSCRCGGCKVAGYCSRECQVR
jgi:hypothetical protein